MTLRFRIARLVLTIVFVAGLAASIAARDDDPRDFSRKNNSRSSNSKVNESRKDSRYERNDNRRGDRDDDDRDDDDDDDDDDDRRRDRDDDRRKNDRDDDDDDDDDDEDDDRGNHQNHGDKKVTICHRDNGHPGGKAITVSWSAVAAHQQHGDTLGPCPVSRCK